MVAKWRKKYQRWWMDHDAKPKGKEKHYIESSNRQDAKKEIRRELETDDAELEADYEFSRDIEDALYCHNFGPCPKCRQEEEK